MKDSNAEMELLEKQRLGLRKELSGVSGQISELVEAKFLPEYTKRYADTYWVGMRSYSKKDIWPVYTHARAVKDIWDTEGNGINCLLVCDSFQCTNSGEIFIYIGQDEYFNALGKRITKTAYEKAKQALLDKLTNRL